MSRKELSLSRKELQVLLEKTKPPTPPPPPGTVHRGWFYPSKETDETVVDVVDPAVDVADSVVDLQVHSDEIYDL